MSGADKNDCAAWCVLPADHDGVCRRAPRPSIAEIEAILAREDDHTIEILPDGTVRSVEGRERKPIERPAGPTYY